MPVWSRFIDSLRGLEASAARSSRGLLGLPLTVRPRSTGSSGWTLSPVPCRLFLDIGIKIRCRCLFLSCACEVRLWEPQLKFKYRHRRRDQRVAGLTGKALRLVRSDRRSSRLCVERCRSGLHVVPVIPAQPSKLDVCMSMRWTRVRVLSMAFKLADPFERWIWSHGRVQRPKALEGRRCTSAGGGPPASSDGMKRSHQRGEKDKDSDLRGNGIVGLTHRTIDNMMA
ncbi:hypothetical protein OG21DRAFT_1264664 [Imleria badia]|nr:hypothetical protein OG21DRAFT_1264664 [Imleria badia]